MRKRGFMAGKLLAAAAFTGMILMASGLTGCGSGEARQADSGAADEAKGGTADESKGGGDDSTSALKGYVFETDGQKIAVDMDMSAVEKQLGEPVKYFEEPSCAAEGIAKIYTYAGFEIDTYPDQGKDLIQSIFLMDDTVATAEGVDLSMTKDDVIAIYGNGYTEEGNCITYEKDGMKLSFFWSEEGLDQISYNSSILD